MSSGSCRTAPWNGFLLLVFAALVSGEQSGVESRGHSETHSVPMVATLAMCLSALLFLLMLCVLLSPKAMSQHCRCRGKAEDWTVRTAHGDGMSLPTYEEAVFGGEVKPNLPSELSSLFPAGADVLQCGPQTVHCLTLNGTPFYLDHFGSSYQMDMVLNGTVPSSEAKCKHLEEPPTYQDIYPTWTDRYSDEEEQQRWILPLTAAPLSGDFIPSVEL